MLPTDGDRERQDTCGAPPTRGWGSSRAHVLDLALLPHPTTSETHRFLHASLDPANAKVVGGEGRLGEHDRLGVGFRRFSLLRGKKNVLR